MTSCCLHDFPSPSLATHYYRPSLQPDLPGNILYRHIIAVDKFELVIQPLLDYVNRFIGVNHLGIRPYFSSIVLHVWFVLFGWYS